MNKCDISILDEYDKWLKNKIDIQKRIKEDIESLYNKNCQ